MQAARKATSREGYATRLCSLAHLDETRLPTAHCCYCSNIVCTLESETSSGPSHSSAQPMATRELSKALTFTRIASMPLLICKARSEAHTHGFASTGAFFGTNK